MDARSSIFKLMEFLAWMLPWTLHGYFNTGNLALPEKKNNKT